MRVLLVSHNKDGSTSVLNAMKNPGRLPSTPPRPTIGFNVEEVEMRHGPSMVMWDVGCGDARLRPLVNHYFGGTHGLVWVVACDVTSEQLHLTKTEMGHILSLTDPNVPLLVLLNKQDLPEHTHTITEANAKAVLGLHSPAMVGTPHEVFVVSAATGDSLRAAFDWLARAAQEGRYKTLDETRGGRGSNPLSMNSAAEVLADLRTGAGSMPRRRSLGDPVLKSPSDGANAGAGAGGEPARAELASGGRSLLNNALHPEGGPASKAPPAGTRSRGARTCPMCTHAVDDPAVTECPICSQPLPAAAAPASPLDALLLAPSDLELVEALSRMLTMAERGRLGLTKSQVVSAAQTKRQDNPTMWTSAVAVLFGKVIKALPA